MKNKRFTEFAQYLFYDIRTTTLASEEDKQRGAASVGEGRVGNNTQDESTYWTRGKQKPEDQCLPLVPLDLKTQNLEGHVAISEWSFCIIKMLEVDALWLKALESEYIKSNLLSSRHIPSVFVYSKPK